MSLLDRVTAMMDHPKCNSLGVCPGDYVLDFCGITPSPANMVLSFQLVLLPDEINTNVAKMFVGDVGDYLECNAGEERLNNLYWALPRSGKQMLADTVSECPMHQTVLVRPKIRLRARVTFDHRILIHWTPLLQILR